MSTNYARAETIARTLCPDSWAAIAYAEYLENVAAATIETQADVASTMAAGYLDDLAEQMEEDCTNAAATLSEEVTRLAGESQINLATVDRESAEFLDLVSEAYENVENESSMLSWKSHLSHNEIVALEANPYAALCYTNPREIVACSDEFIDAAKTVAADHFADGNVAFKDGYYDMRRMVANQLIQSVFGFVPAAVQKVGGFTDPIGATIAIDFDSTASFSVSEIANEISRSAAAAFASAGMFRATAFENASDRITQFSNYVTSRGTEFMDQARATVSSVRDCIADVNFEIHSAFDWFKSMTGLDQLIAGGTPDMNGFSQFTGANPVTSMSLDVIGVVGKVVGMSVALALYAVGNAIQSFSDKVADWFTSSKQTLVSPFDLSDVQSVGSPGAGLVDNWMYCVEFSRSVNFLLPRFAMSSDVDTATRIAQYTASFFNQSEAIDGGICWKTYGGELVLKVTQPVSFTVAEDPVLHVYRYSGSVVGQLQVKPYCVNFVSLRNWLEDHRSLWNGAPYYYNAAEHFYSLYLPKLDEQSTISDFADTLSEWHKTGNMYAGYDKDTAESLYLVGYACGIYLMFLSFYLIASAMTLDQAGACADTTRKLEHFYAREIKTTECFIPSLWHFQDVDITNKHFVVATTGWNADTQAPAFQDKPNWDALSDVLSADQLQGYHGYFGTQHSGDVTIITSEMTLTSLVDLILSIMCDQRCERFSYPTDYLFVPYSQSVVAFSPADWHIATDEENRQAAAELMTKVGMVALAVVGYIAVGKIMHTVKEKGYMKWNAVKGPLDNKLWNGGALSAAEQKLYLQASCKLDAIGDIFAATGGGVKGFFSRLFGPVRGAVSLTRTAIGKITGTVSALRSKDTTCENPDYYGHGVESEVDTASVKTLAALQDVSDDLTDQVDASNDAIIDAISRGNADLTRLIKGPSLTNSGKR